VIYKFTVPGDPMPWHRPVDTPWTKRGRSRDPKNEGRRQAIQWLARQAGIRQPYDCPMLLMFVSYHKIPKSKAGQGLEGTPYPQTPDKDNLEKLLLDALKGIAWTDDKLVTAGQQYKRYCLAGMEPHIRVCIADDNLSVAPELMEN
jgi:Holliday junction resolvase RusA-like endonuclease